MKHIQQMWDESIQVERIHFKALKKVKSPPYASEAWP